MTFLARSLLKNSMNDRMQRMIQNKKASIQQANIARAEPEDFSKAFPMYYEMLCNYSDLRMFKPEIKVSNLQENIHPNLLINKLSSSTKNPPLSRVKTAHERKVSNISMTYRQVTSRNNFEHARKTTTLINDEESVSEHGNYKMFGMQRFKRVNKFLTQNSSMLEHRP